MTELEQAWYKPREIASLGLIRNYSGSDNEGSNYEFILNLIRTGKLAARDVSNGSRPMYLVSRDEIKRYMDEWS